MSSSSKSKSSGTKTNKSSKQRVASSTASPNNNNNNGGVGNNPARSSGYLLTCDPPVKQFIMHLNDQKIVDKKFIIEDMDANHLLIKGEARDEITRKVEEWMDMVSNSRDVRCF